MKNINTKEKPKLKNKINYYEYQLVSKYLYKSASLFSLLLLLLLLIIMKKISNNKFSSDYLSLA